MKTRITPEPGTLVEYASQDLRVPLQVYFLTGETYTWHQSYSWCSDAYDAARDLMRDKKLTVKLYNALTHKWIGIPR